MFCCFFFFFKQKTAYEMRISDWSSDVCSSDLLAVLQAVAGKGTPVVTVLLSGRPLYANDLINLSDAFVAGWLPGSEGKGVADVLFAGADGKPAHDFRGTLSFAWPGVSTEERRVGKVCVRTCRYRWPAYH